MSSTDDFQWFNHVIFEISNLFPVEPNNSLTGKSGGHEMMNASDWYDFEKGAISEEQCRQLLSWKMNVPEILVQEAMETEMMKECSPEMLALIEALRERHRLSVVGNLPYPFLERIRTRFNILDFFDHVFISSQMGERLPHPAFFKSMMRVSTFDPQRTLYIGSTLDNVVTARSLGFHGILCRDVTECARIRAICSNPIPKAKEFLRRNASHLDLETESGVIFKDAFAQFLILDATKDESLIEWDRNVQIFTWLYQKPPKGFRSYPPDIDTNSIALSVLGHLDETSRHRVMDKMLQYVNPDGILETYLTKDRPRICATACVNAVALFHEFGRGAQVIATEDWIYQVLRNRAYRDGTRYYPSGDFFLYFMSRLLLKAPHLRDRFGETLRECMLERKGLPGDALSLACRIIASARVGVSDTVDLERLLAMHMDDGSWGAGICYCFVRDKGIPLYHQGLTAALAILAIKEWDQLRRRQMKMEEPHPSNVRCRISMKGLSRRLLSSGWRTLLFVLKDFLFAGLLRNKS